MAASTSKTALTVRVAQADLGPNLSRVMGELCEGGGDMPHLAAPLRIVPNLLDGLEQEDLHLGALL